MKKASLLLLLSMVLCNCTGQKTAYLLHGSIQEKDIDKLYLISSGQVIDSAEVSDKGEFSFKGEIILPKLANIANTRNLRVASLNCTVILEPGDLTMVPLGFYDEYKVTGSRTNDLFNTFVQKSIELTQYYEAHEGQDGIIEEVQQKWKTFLVDGAKKNSGNLFGLICLREVADDLEPQEVRNILDSFKARMQETDLWKALNERNVKLMGTAPGSPYTEFSQTDIHGNVISSKDVLAAPGVKYVLIDFWASWCGPCMREVPYLKETYSKYFEKGFQILGVSLDRSKDAWLKAITDNQMNWVHVSDLKYWDNEVSREYGITSIPANFLVDASTGMIIATNLRGDDLERKISELLK